MADERPKGEIPRRDDGASDASPQDTMEAKRLEARRRFLLGGAAALPVILHVTAIGAQVDPPPPVDPIGSFSFCLSLTGETPTVNFDQSTTAFICPK